MTDWSPCPRGRVFVQKWIGRLSNSWVEVLFLLTMLALTLAFGTAEVDSIYGGF